MGSKFFCTWCAFALSCALSGQVAVREQATFAHVTQTPAAVSVGLTNFTTGPLQAVLTLEWIPPQGKPDAVTRRTIELNPGDSNWQIPLPLAAVGNPLTERLRYQISTASRNYSAFATRQGILSLPEIADDAFTLNVVSADVPRRNRPYSVHILAEHPVTHKPMAGIAIRCKGSSAVTDADGATVLQIPAGDPAETTSVTIEGKLGDYLQKRELFLQPKPDAVHIYTDKPLYQPGQTMHIRFLALSSAGPVQAHSRATSASWMSRRMCCSTQKSTLHASA
jgi:hypothetical protein